MDVYFNVSPELLTALQAYQQASGELQTVFTIQ